MERRGSGEDGVLAGVLRYLRRHHLGLIAIFIALSGTAYAAHKVAPKNSVTAKSIRKGAVTHAKLAPSSVDGSNVVDGSLTGAEVNAATLGTVASATRAGSAESAGRALRADSAFTADSATTADQAADSSRLGGVDASSYTKKSDPILQGDLTGTYEDPRVELQDSARLSTPAVIANAACPAGLSGPSVTVHVPQSGLVEVLALAEIVSFSNATTGCITVDGGSPRTVFKAASITTRYTAGSSENGTTDPFAAQWIPFFDSPGTHTYTLAFGSPGSADFVDHAVLVVRAIS